MFTNNFDPVAFQIFSFEIRWYSLAYILGILIGWLISKKFFIFQDEIYEKFDDYVTYVILGIILGGRLGYVFFYNPGYYANNLIDVFKIWQGGMSFHGGLLGVVIVTIFFAKKNNDNPFIYLDAVALAAPIGIFFGRISNFVNSELYGTVTNIPWAVKFVQVDNLYRHPSQLYEATLEGIALFIILLYFRKIQYLKTPGLISSLFLVFYSLFRFFTEFFRVPDEHLGYLLLNLTMGQLISLVLFFTGVYLFIKKNENKKQF
tara:strand:- start:1026 stop:1808 length:783 start_codon:yes stop_codon:yes gene_type:complete